MHRLRFASSLWLIGVALSIDAQVPQRLPESRIDVVMPRETSRWPDSLRRVMRDSIATAHRRWLSKRPTQYLFASATEGGLSSIDFGRERDGQLTALRIRGDSVMGRMRKRSATATRLT